MATHRCRGFQPRWFMPSLTLLALSFFLSVRMGIRQFYKGFQTVGQSNFQRHLQPKTNHGKPVEQKPTSQGGVLRRRDPERSSSGKVLNVGGGLQDRRSLTLRLACSRLHWGRPLQHDEARILSNLVYDDSQNTSVVFCDNMPEITGMSRKLYALMNSVVQSQETLKTLAVIPDQIHFRNLRNVSFLQGHKVLRDSLKVLFVSEPYSRLLQVYLQIVLDTFRGRTEANVDNEATWTNNTTSVTTYPQSLSFAQFLEMFLEMYQTSSPGPLSIKNGALHQSWNSAHESCGPCHVRYDYIGKLDKLGLELKYTFSASHFEKFYNVKQIVGTWEREMAEQLVSSAMDLSRSSCVPLRLALDRVWTGLQLTGLVPLKESLVLKDSDSLEDTKNDFMTQIDEAFNQKVSSRAKYKMVRYAYQRVPKRTLQRLKKALLPECLLFGYDPDLVM